MTDFQTRQKALAKALIRNDGELSQRQILILFPGMSRHVIARIRKALGYSVYEEYLTFPECQEFCKKG